MKKSKTTKQPKTTKPATVHDELELIRRANGGLLDPVEVVHYARFNRDSCLHSRFEWVDSIAAEQFRIWQARQIIRLELTVLDNGHGEAIRTYVSLIADRRSDNERGYRALVDVLSDDEMRAQLLEEARQDMAVFRHKYRMLRELACVFDAMNKV